MSLVLVRIALRNLRLHWVRTLIVGILLVFGTFLFVVGQSALSAIQNGMRTSVIDSLAGDIQIYSSKAKDPLELYGSFAMGVPDLGQIEDISKVKAALADAPEVKSMVPMGLHKSVVWGNTMIDIKLGELRKAITAGDKATTAQLEQHVRLLTKSLETEMDKLESVAATTTDVKQQRADLLRAQSDEFWAHFDEAPLDNLEFLDNRIGPLGLESNMFFFNYVGTDPQAFQKNFDLFEIVDGQAIPPGERGFLFNTLAYERFVKHPTARGLDMVKEALEDGKTIATDPDTQRTIERLVKQVSQVTDQVEPAQVAPLTAALQKELGSTESDLQKLVSAFLKIDDQNFKARYDAFYREIAPRIRLHAFRVGETLTLQSQTKSGYMSAVNVKIWGVFRFKGLEKSTLAGFTHIMDLETFRDLYGLTNPTSSAEVEALKAKSGIKKVDRATAEDDLFGGGDAAVGGKEVENKAFDDTAGADLAGLRRAAEQAAQAKYTQDDIDHGPCLDIAVFLKDSDKLEDGVKAVQARLDAAGIPARAVSWKDAQGRLVGGVVTGVSFFFNAIVAVIMLVVFIIIILGLALSTMQRLREVGTMRAIGAQRNFVVRMVGVEALTMGLGFGFIGTLLGTLLLAALGGGGGIPARSDMQYFIFGGAALKPDITLVHVLGALVLGILVTLLASLVPAVIAARVKPIAAMQAKE
ncbi:MAG: FtsX-like permease family protein [Myxococcota bacterium]